MSTAPEGLAGGAQVPAPTKDPMSTVPEGPAGGAQVPAPAKEPVFKNCWSCRLLSGGGLILSGAYVFSAARTAMRKGGPTSMGIVAQITFAASIAAWGIVIIADPLRVTQKKT